MKGLGSTMANITDLPREKKGDKQEQKMVGAWCLVAASPYLVKD